MTQSSVAPASAPSRRPKAEWRDDWPAPGTTPDLESHDPPHLADGLDWWWFNARLDGDGGEFGLVFYFLRHRTPTSDGAPLDSHAVVWFRSDPATASHSGESWLDEGCVELFLAVAATDQTIDPRVRDALTEGLARGGMPIPDRALPRPVRVDGTRLDLDYGVARLRKDGDDYLAEADGAETGFSLRLTPLKSAVQQVFPGPGKWSGSDGTYTYFVPRLAVEGSFRTGERTESVTGDGWYEHAFGDAWHRVDRPQPAADPVWTWAGLRLDNGWDVSAYSVGRTDVASEQSFVEEPFVVAVSPEGRRVEAPARLSSARPWTSLATLNTYGTVWEAEVPELELRLSMRAWFPQQEIRSLLFGSGMLEAQVAVEGTMAGRDVNGHGLCEVFPSNRIGDFERHITRVREVTRQEIDLLYPPRPNGTLTSAAGSEDRPDRLDELVAEDLHLSLVEPLRHATAGLGKSWRSDVAIAAIELCGGDSEPYRPLLAATELMHTGCLIIDDVQDDSPLRRGRAAAHTVFGVPTAINAGTAAYFAFDRVLHEVLPDDDRLRLRVYQTYLRALRAGHAGQALDITGHTAAMDTAVTTGDASTVLRRIRTAHRLKTAASVRAVAEIGALIARADEERIMAMGDYFEAVGLAYQISDDVIDLRGVTTHAASGERKQTKHTAEDLHAGKVTMPLAHAVALVPAPRMREIWHAVRKGDADSATVASVVADLEAYGAVDACTEEARRLVDESWKPLQDLLPCGWHSVQIRALGAYSAQRESE